MSQKTLFTTLLLMFSFAPTSFATTLIATADGTACALLQTPPMELVRNQHDTGKPTDSYYADQPFTYALYLVEDLKVGERITVDKWDFTKVDFPGKNEAFRGHGEQQKMLEAATNFSLEGKCQSIIYETTSSY